MDVVIRYLTGVTAAALLTACGSNEPEPESTLFDADGDVVSLGVTADADRVHVVWVERNSDDGVGAFHAISDDGGLEWTEPVAIDTDQPPPDRVHRSNDLRIAADGDRLLVVWQTVGDGFADSGPMVMARSDDGGAHWQPAATPVADDDTDSHGFFALSRAPDSAFHLAWLDSRDGQQGVHHARSDDGGRSWSAVTTANSATCQCCWNSLAHPGDETVLMYRGLDPRDMAVASMGNGDDDWSASEPVGRFDWFVDACPHVGGGLATDDNGALHALVWTGAEAHSGVHHLRRGSGGAWSEPEQLGRTAARAADLVATTDGGLLAAWDHGSADHGIGVAHYQDGAWSNPATLGGDARRPGFPLVTATDDTAQVFWTERREDGTRTWRATRLPPR
ncbi:exo-alpha-sialidase [Aquisalimonas asiatica]|uniref:BNR repeat-like domain-containing protein n=1 Tax=Aquisalimonas asiatica TaxID=406100 RepID=A0A1H8TCY1_9GAMM|nr:exo-alpha-sialidase [Aquisalimonas asiatica]SEO88960.1 BNR repeat-like domain-containing protein [Aquisalimonas asiatica]